MRASASVLVAAPLAVVRDVVMDFEAYPSFLETTTRAQVLREGRGAWEVRFWLRLVRELRYTLELLERPGSAPGAVRIEWTLVEGAFRANDGSWELIPEGPGSTRANYEVDLKLGMYVPRSILNTLLEVSLPANLEAFRSRAEAIARAGSGSAPGDG